MTSSDNAARPSTCSADQALERAQAALNQINGLLGCPSPALGQPVSYDLLEDLLAVLPSRQGRRACCSL